MACTSYHLAGHSHRHREESALSRFWSEPRWRSLRKGLTMKVFTYGPRATQSRSFTGLSVLPCMLALFVIAALVMLVGGAAAAVTAVPLGTSDSFAVLAGA